MTKLRLSLQAEADLSDIVAFLLAEAGPRVAETYAKRFRAAMRRLVEYPRSGAPRPQWGDSTRIAIISPYVLIYDFVSNQNTVVVQRILHGRRNIEKLLTTED